MARNARIYGVLIYLWIHSRFLFDFYLSQFNAKKKKKNQFFINPYISRLRIQRFFTNISTVFFPSPNRDMERDTTSVIMIYINSTVFYRYFKIIVGDKLEGRKFEKDRPYFFSNLNFVVLHSFRG